MLILLTLSLLPSGDRNSTSDLVSRAVNAGGELKKSFQILLNDTEAMDTANLDPQNEKWLRNKPNTDYMKQMVQLLNEQFSTLPHIKESTPGNIPQVDDAYYNTPPQVRVVKHSKKFQKHKKDLSKLNIPPEDLETTPSTNIYYDTPPVILGVDSNAILKKKYGIRENITLRRKVPKHNLRRYDTLHKRAQREEGYRRNRSISRKHIRLSPTVQENAISLLDFLQTKLNKSRVNIADESPVSHKSGLKKRFHISQRQVSTFEPINILQGDETLLDTDQPVPAYDEQEESSEKVFSTPPNIMRSSSLGPGDVLYGIVLTQPSTKDPQIEDYYKKMEANNIGYLSVAFEVLCEQLASKKQEHVAEIVKHTEFIVQELQNTGRLRWLGEPMTTILRDLAIRLSTDSTDVLQVRAMILKSLMQQRRKIVGTDVNDIIDYADSLITKEQGEHLLNVMQNVKRYPDGNKSGKELCKEIIEAFETPFHHLSGTKDLEHMVKTANKAFADRFQQFRDLREAKDHTVGESSSSGLTQYLKQRTLQNSIHSPKVQSVTKSRKITRAMKHLSDSKHLSKDKFPSIDKHPLKNEHQSINKHSLKRKRHNKHKNSSHKPPTKEEDKDPSEEGEAETVTKDKIILKHKYSSSHKRATINENKDPSEGGKVEIVTTDKRILKHKHSSSHKRPTIDEDKDPSEEGEAETVTKDKRILKQKHSSSHKRSTIDENKDPSEGGKVEIGTKDKRILKQKHSSSHKRPTIDEDKDPSEEEAETVIKDKRILKHKHSSSHKRPTIDEDKDPSEGGKVEIGTKDKRILKHKHSSSHKRPTIHEDKDPSEGGKVEIGTKDKRILKHKHSFSHKRPTIDEDKDPSEEGEAETVTKDKRILKHKHSSSHKHPTTDEDKDPSEGGKVEIVTKDKRILKHKHIKAAKDITPFEKKHSHTKKRSSEDATVLKRRHTHLKPGLLMGNI